MEYYRAVMRKSNENEGRIFARTGNPNQKSIRFKREDAHLLNNTSIIKTYKSEGERFLDYYDAPAFLISDKLKAILEKYDDEIIFKCTVFMDVLTCDQKIYWLMLPQETDCIRMNKELNQFVLNLDLTDNKDIFQVDQTVCSDLIVSLDVVESLYRRNMTGLDFIPIIS